jgi:hypothetical protein
MRIVWVTLTVLSVLVAAYGLMALVLPGFGPPFLAERRVETPWAVYAHLGGGLWALAAGPWQLHRQWRDAAPRFHRWLGRSYVLGVLVGAVGALALAPRAQTGGIAQAGFGLLGGLWLAFTVLAFLRIRRRDQVAHRRWMLRSFALTLAAVTLRLYLPLSAAMGWSFEAAYPAIAWLCWVPNLLVTELYLGRSRQAVPAAMV